MDETLDLGALRDSIREMLAAECPRERIVRHSQHGSGIDRELWAKAVELGWMLIPIPEAEGGLGLGIEAVALLHEEAGRAAAPLPLLSSTLAAHAISAHAPAEQRACWLPRIAQGVVFATAVPTTLAPPQITFHREGDTLVLAGTVTDLLDGADADLLLLTACDEAGQTYRLVLDVVEDGLAMARDTLWDRGRSLARMQVDGLRLPADRAWRTDAATESTLADHAAIALAADSVGGQDALLEMTIEYLKTRHQFGRAIGSFQALKHRVADHRTRLEGGRWLARSAAGAVARGLAHASSEASAAKALAAADYIELGRDAVQLHGGIGFTAEYPCHVYVKRAFLNEQLFGGRSEHLRRAAAPVLAGAA